MIQPRGMSARSIVTMTDRAVSEENACAVSMIVTCDVWILERAVQAKSQLNKVFQAETAVNVGHEPELTP
jgi:hypothetical protein